jgi:hypothetical protein
LNTLGLLACWASVSTSAAAAGGGGEFGGKSSMPLRPQPPSVSAATLSTMTAHPRRVGL